MTPVDPIAVAVLVTRVLAQLGIVHTIGGSIAASFAGEPRSTVDIDVVAALDDTQVAGVVAALSPEFYVDEDAVRRAVRSRTSVNLIHHATMLKVDVFVAGGTSVDAEQLQRRLLVTLEDGTALPIHPPEDILHIGSAVARRARHRQGPGEPARPRVPSAPGGGARGGGSARTRGGIQPVNVRTGQPSTALW